MGWAYDLCLIDEVLASKEFDEAVLTCETLSTFNQRLPEISQLADLSKHLVEVYRLFQGKASPGNHGLPTPL